MRIMVIELQIIPIFIFLLSLIGILINRTNIILLLICIEVMLLSISLNFLIISFSANSILGQITSIYIITVAAVESAIGLSIMIAFYKIRGSIGIRFLNILKG